MNILTFGCIFIALIYAQLRDESKNWQELRDARRTRRKNRLGKNRITTTKYIIETTPVTPKPKWRSKTNKDDYFSANYFSINTENLGLQVGYDAVNGPRVHFQDMLIQGRSGRERSGPASIHPNTRNIAGMLRYRLLALGVTMNFKDLLGYGCWCTFLIKHDMLGYCKFINHCTTV